MTLDPATNGAGNTATVLGNYALRRTDARDRSFIALVKELDADLAVRDGKDHAFYASFNTLDPDTHAVVVLQGEVPVGCGAFKPLGKDAVEVKRMYVPPVHRQQGIASLVLRELEKWAGELGYVRCMLETGRKQPEAIALYRRSGYQVVANYGPYIGVENSVCFEKRIR